ncbi:YDG domain-containing protein [uncultured Enorma sp.]|uniref:YDG domain-containing protein n=1 Tax=uncultured Enorma sp. TaxID=1714346 RepID=UPI00280641C0|nr:YDG domain-containing protein [uncultured Enorma sp.]
MRACTTLSIGATLLVMAPAVALAAISHNGQEVSAGDSYTVNELGTCQGHVFSGISEDNWYNLPGGQHITVSGGTHTITLDGLTIDDPGAGSSAINIRDGANVTLVLKGENYLEASGNHPGIWVEEGSSLTIEGDGSLVVYAGNTTAGLGAAGIGGGYNESAFGNITINSGSVEAHGRAGGAGIGGGYKIGSGTQTGDVTITGGFVQAYGGSVIGSSGAGIGAGENADYDGTITISGGVVRAMGGNENKSSIGGGGSLLGSTDNGTFTTGTNGNAVIAAPWGIGDTSDVANWDCILLEPTRESTSEIQFVNYDATTNTITFEGGTPRVYGDVEADYNITINSPASLRVDTEIDLDGDPSTPNNAPSTLTMKSGTTLTNNNKSSDPGIAGIALMPGSTLVLEDGTSQCQGSGTMIATSTEGTGLVRGKVQLPLSDDMVSVNPTSYVYDGTEKEPAVTVQFPKWNFTQTFEQGTEYTVAYEHNVNVGMAKAIATSAGGNLLNTVDGNASTGTAGFEITQGDFTVSTVARRYIQVGEEHLLSKLPTKPTFGANNPPNVDGGTFSWYSDEACTTPLTDTFVQNEPEGAQITVYWKYTQTGNPNVVPTKTGKTVLVMTNEKPPAVQVDGKTDDTSIHATYGDPSYTPDIKISLDGGQSWIALLSDVTYSVDSQTPAGNGGVVTVDEKTGEIQFVGAGTATVIAEIDAYTDPDATADDKGDSYGAAYITIEVKVDPKQVTVDESSVQAVDRAYNGTRKVEVTAELTAAETVGTDLADDAIGVAATGEAAQPAVGTDISVTVTYTLTGDKADDYVLTNDPGATVTISKAQAGDDTLQGKTGELTISNCAAATYVFDLNELVPDSKQVEGGALYPGWIEFENPVVNISDDRYFTVDDIRIDNATHTLYLTVNDVESQDVDELGTITLDMVSPNFEGMTGIITIKRENLDIYTITASAGEGGTISPEGAVEVVTGHSQDFAISADEGYEIADVVVDGVSQGALSTYRFEDVTANHTIEVTFKSVDESTEPSDGDDAPGSDAGSDDDALLGTGDSSLLMVAGTMCVGAASVAGGLVLARKRR